MPWGCSASVIRRSCRQQLRDIPGRAPRGSGMLKARAVPRQIIAQGKKSIVDHVLTNKAAEARTSNLRVLEETYMGGTEHRPLIFEVIPLVPTVKEVKAPRPWNRLWLKDPEV